MKKGLQFFYILVMAIIIVDFFVDKSHAHYPWERLPLFYGLYGFASYVTLVYIAKYILRPLVKREEDYYEQ